MAISRVTGCEGRKWLESCGECAGEIVYEGYGEGGRLVVGATVFASSCGIGPARKIDPYEECTRVGRQELR